MTSSSTYGALLLGALFASVLSGFVCLQTTLYFKLFPTDGSTMKSLVLIVWLFDLVHTSLVWTSVWKYLIANFGDQSYVDFIPNTIAFSIVLTAILTFLAHCFYAHRIHGLSHRNWYITVPILLLATGRLGSASATGAKMIELQHFSLFREKFRWLFSLGLVLSSAVDILITVVLFILLKKSKAKSFSLDEVIDACILYTFEIGSLTSITTVVSLICWLSLKHSLLFLGFHFVIGKLYANSLLASLNTRQNFRHSRATAVNLVNMQTNDKFRPKNFRASDPSASGVQVDIVKRVQYDPETPMGPFR